MTWMPAEDEIARAEAEREVDDEPSFHFDRSDPEHARRVIMTYVRRGTLRTTDSLSYRDYRDMQTVGGVTAAAAETSTPLLLGRGETSERVRGKLVTAGYFPLLGVTPRLGRFFTEEESARDRAQVAVLSHAFWRARFGSDPGVLGTTLTLGRGRYSVIGVAPPEFTGSTVSGVDVFLPLEAASGEAVDGEWDSNYNFRWVEAIVRVAPDRPIEAVAEEATALSRRARAHVRDNDPNAVIRLAPLGSLGGPTEPGETGVAAMLAAVSLQVLVIACANVANLFLARALRRSRQIAVRLALGAGRRRLVVEQALEGALLALAGGVVAVALAAWTAPVTGELLLPGVAWPEARVAPRTLVFPLVVALGGGIASSLLPAWQTSRTNPATWLKAGSPRATFARTRTQTAMLRAQGTLSIVLLVGAGLFVRSLDTVQSLDLGLDTDALVAAYVVRDGQSGTRPTADIMREAAERVRHIPGVERVALVAGTTPFLSSWAIRVQVAGLPDRPRIDSGGPYVQAVSSDYFATSGTKILEGRPITSEDRRGAPPVAVVNQSMARLYWPGETALGHCLLLGDDPSPPCVRVVGVAANTRRQELFEDE